MANPDCARPRAWSAVSMGIASETTSPTEHSGASSFSTHEEPRPPKDQCSCVVQKVSGKGPIAFIQYSVLHRRCKCIAHLPVTKAQMNCSYYSGPPWLAQCIAFLPPIIQITTWTTFKVRARTWVLTKAPQHRPQHDGPPKLGEKPARGPVDICCQKPTVL
jgi:hypothetical protein